MLVHRKISTLALIYTRDREGEKENKNMKIPPSVHMSYHNEHSELCLTWERSNNKIDNTLCHRIYCKEKNSSNVWGAIRCDLIRDDERGLVVALQEDILLTSHIGSPLGSVWCMTGDTWRLCHSCFCSARAESLYCLYGMHGIRSKGQEGGFIQHVKHFFLTAKNRWCEPANSLFFYSSFYTNPCNLWCIWMYSFRIVVRNRSRECNFLMCTQCSEVCWLNNEAPRMQRHKL